MFIRNGNVLLPDGTFTVADVRIDNGRIAEIGQNLSSNGEVIDATGRYVLPGLIDIHIHGADGSDAQDGAKAVAHIAKVLPRYGVTSFLPTTASGELSDLAKVFEVSPDSYTAGSRVLGYHMEGPFLNPLFKGAHDEKLLRDPDADYVLKYPHIKMVTIAPELRGGTEFLRRVRDRVVINIGHSAADYHEACTFMDEGVSCVTHLYNAHTRWHHRNAGIVGAAYDKGIYVQLVCDNVHLHPSIYKMAVASYGLDKCVIVSDAMRAAALGNGSYGLAGQQVIVRNGRATLADGTIAGSIGLLWNGVRNLIEAGYTLETAMRMGTHNPATLIGRADVGALEVGSMGDVVIADQAYDITHTIIGGAIAYSM